MPFEQPPFRPPSEAFSLLIRASRNCPWNKCEFCCMYKGEKFEIREPQEIKEDIIKAKSFVDELKEIAWKEGLKGDIRPLAEYYQIPYLLTGEVKTAFIGDSNSLVMKTEQLEEIIKFLYQNFLTLKRTTSYARAKTILRKSLDELKRLKEAGLSRLHLGLETGDDELLAYIKKGVTAEEMIEAGKKVKESGISLSEYVILGLGGKKRTREHAEETAEVLNKIDPDFIRIRTLMLIPGTPLLEKWEKGEFELLTPEEILEEEKILMENLEVNSNFVSDHVLNYLRIDGKLPEEKQKMLNHINLVLQKTPEERKKIFQPEELRRL